VPMKPLKRCSAPGCTARVTEGDCSKHRRPTNRILGYDAAWTRLRDAFIAAHPFCAFCGDVAQQVDHVRPFYSRHDPLRLDRFNLRSLCTSCHARRSRRQQLEQPGVPDHGHADPVQSAPGIYSHVQNEEPGIG